MAILNELHNTVTRSKESLSKQFVVRCIIRAVNMERQKYKFGLGSVHFESSDSSYGSRFESEMGLLSPRIKLSLPLIYLKRGF